MDGATLAGWIIGVVGFAGLYGALKNTTWLSVLTTTVNPSAKTNPLVTGGGAEDTTVHGEGSSAVALSAVAFAMAQRGKPYRWGATGPDAYDCSGLVYAAYKSVGVRLPRVTYTQLRAGRKVPDLSHVVAGDLVFPDAGHVMMAIGGGQVVQAPHTGTVVQVSPMPSSTVAIRRVA